MEGQEKWYIWPANKHSAGKKIESIKPAYIDHKMSIKKLDRIFVVSQRSEDSGKQITKNCSISMAWSGIRISVYVISSNIVSVSGILSVLFPFQKEWKDGII